MTHTYNLIEAKNSVEATKQTKQNEKETDSFLRLLDFLVLFRLKSSHKNFTVA